jgi:ureidoacrylate peracid hydrolase
MLGSQVKEMSIRVKLPDIIALFTALFLIMGAQFCFASMDLRVVTVQAKPEPIIMDLKKTAVIVTDMQNAYASKGGIFDRVGQDISGARTVIDNTLKIISAARVAGIKIIYLKMDLAPGSQEDGSRDLPSKHKGLGANRPKNNNKPMLQNPWNREIVDELKPLPGDIVIEKKRYSGFSGTNLNDVLKNSDITHLIFTGITTNVCVESTIRDAYSLDYWSILVADGTNHAGPSFTQQATLWNVEAFLGWVSTTNDILKAIEAK